ncbi:transient receptor potential cation channel subfamily M member 8 [Aplysia californica]|uniref:Transient receptor potential cation channel subfamily M member 8 n=1 Tax=Aplysia californica TaxID=6500 RepID=A0ABM0JWB2_APLCA|nr:transient receptor potential cation channel subfamily M member 8 [Aplysia californica]
MPHLCRNACVPAIVCPPLIWFIVPRDAQDQKTKTVGSRRHTAPKTEANNANTDNQDLSPNSPPDDIETPNVLEDYMCDCGVLRTLTQFYSCPKVKLSMDVLFYIVFQGIYSYFLIFSLGEEDSHAVDFIVELWGACYCYGVAREFISNMRRSTQLSKYCRYWYISHWNRYDVTLCVTFFLALFLNATLTGQDVIWARIVFSINFIMFFFRILNNFAAHKRLGPLVTMLYGMTYDLLFFLLFLFMFMVAYVVSSEAILHSNAELSWHGVFLIFRRAYLQIFGEEIEDTDTYSYSWCTRNASLANESMTMCGLDDVGSYVGAVLPGIYFLLTNIMLLNLLIAMFK